LKDEGKRLALTLWKDTGAYLPRRTKRFLAEESDDAIGDLKALLVLDFCLKEIGPSVYNQAIADAQSYMQEKVTDLGGVRYEPEAGFWKK